MGITKADKFSVRQNQVATWLKALAHPARIAIIEHILQSNRCICNDLVNELQLAQATVSQHLKELKTAGIIQGEIEGTKVCYCINTEVWKELKQHLAYLFDSYTPIDKCC